MLQNFRNAAPLLAEYHAQHSDKPGPSVRLDQWLDAYKNGEIADSHEDDNKPESQPWKNSTDGAPALATVPAKKPNRVTKNKKGKKT